MSYLNEHELKLLKILTAGEFQTANSLANMLDINEKTVRNLIKGLSSYLNNYGAMIIVKRKVGYALKICNEKLFQELLEKSRISNRNIPVTQDGRMNYILYHLLTDKRGYLITEFMDELAVTYNTIKSDLIKLENDLKKYHLELQRDSQSNRLFLMGNEYKMRLCGADILFQKSEKIELSIISKTVEEVFEKFEIQVSDVTISQFIHDLQVAIDRIKNHYMIEESMIIDDTHISYEDLEYKMANMIAYQLSVSLRIEFNPYEIEYIVMHLKGIKLKDGKGSVVVNGDIDALITEIIEMIQKSFSFDLSKDLDLRISLYYHFVPLLWRIQYGLVEKNPLLSEIKKKYKLAFLMAKISATVFKKYGYELVDDEIAYIALFIQLFMDKAKKINKKKKIVLVCHLGKVGGELLKNNYLEKYGEKIDLITTCSRQELRLLDLEKYDYIFTTIHIKDEYPIPVIEINYFFSEYEEEKIKRMISSDINYQIVDYFPKELFVQNMVAKNNVDAIKQLCDIAMMQGIVDNKFYDSVLLRERYGETDLCNLSAIPHPDELLGKKTCACVGILEQPIHWKSNDVQIILLLIPGSKGGPEKFYELVSKFVLNETYVRRLIRERSYTKFLEMINGLTEKE